MARPKKTARAETVRTERRRKRGDTVVDGRKLTVPEDEMDPNFEYRFAADRGGRVQALHSQDWDVVEDRENPHGGAEESGKPYKMVLMKKRKDWHEADQKEKLARTDVIESQLKGNNAGEMAAQTDADLARHAYTPGSGNSLEVSRQGYKP